MRPQKLYTVKIEGPEEIQFQLPGNPSVEHRGGFSVHHLMLSEREADLVRGLILSHGGIPEVRPMRGQTSDQTRMRATMMQPKEAVKVPCESCPECPWLDPFLPEGLMPCGLVSWPRESVETLQETSEIHREAARECPVGILTTRR